MSQLAPTPIPPTSAVEVVDTTNSQSLTAPPPPPSHDFILPDIKNVITPPPDLKPVIEKTAAYVARMGTAFEAVILGKNQTNRRFDFLHPDNPFHSFYKTQLVTILREEAGIPAPEVTEDENKNENATSSVIVRDDKENSMDIVQEKKESKASIVPDAPKLSFKEQLKRDISTCTIARVTPTSAARPELCVSVAPYDVSAPDLEILRLTARFGSIAGRSFIVGLQSREQRNPQFDFLRPSHGLFTLFQRMSDAYDSITLTDGHRRTVARENRNNSDAALDEILGRIEYERIQKTLRDEKVAEDEEDRAAMGMIDWHAFVVMRTVDFVEGDGEMLPTPLSTVEEINCVLDAQEKLDAAQAAAGVIGAGDDDDGDEDMDMDLDMDMDMEEQDQDESVVQPVISSEAPAPISIENAPVQEVEEAPSTNMQKCPSCNELIQDSDMSEHVRICLLDPRWKQQKEASLQKQRESNLIQGPDMSKHLSSFARRRPDIFEGESLPEEPATPIPDRVMWDGHPSTMRSTIAQSQGRFQPPNNMPPRPPTQPLPPQPPAQPCAPMPPPAQLQPPPPQSRPPPPPAQPAPPRQPPTQPPPPPAKRTKTGDLPEADFAAIQQGLVKINVELPISNENPEWKLNGSTISAHIDVMKSIADVKEHIAVLLGGLPVKKQKLQDSRGRWLKDKDTLAFYNVGQNAVLKLGLKGRGRKK